MILALCAALSVPSATPPPVPALARPIQDRGLVHRAAGAFDGYTLFAPLRSTTTYLVDLDGEVVHTWPSDLPPGNSVYLLPNGNLLRCGRVADNPTFFAGGQGGRIRELAWDGTVLWDYALSDERVMQHHDVEPLPNGNVLAIVYEAKTRAEALAAGRDPGQVDAEGLWADAVLEIRPVRPRGGEVVWEWHVWDHLVQDRDADLRGFGSPRAHPELVDVNADHRDEPPLGEEELRELEELADEMAALGYLGGDDEDDDAPVERRRGLFSRADWLHTNSIDYDAERDLILLGTPNLHEIWVIDHSTTTAEARGHAGGRHGRGGDLLYRWGNPLAYGAGGPDDRRLFAQHDARWIPEGCPGAGHVLVFDNGRDRGEEPYSAVLELALPWTPQGRFARADGAAFGPAAPEWEYVAPEPASFYASFISGAQRLPNGNTLVCSGPDGRVFEVTLAGEVVWEYRKRPTARCGVRLSAASGVDDIVAWHDRIGTATN